MELEINRSAIVDTGFLDLLIFRQRPSELKGRLKSQATAQSRITVLELIQPRKQNSLVASNHFSEVCEEGEIWDQRSFILQEFKIDYFLTRSKLITKRRKGSLFNLLMIWQVMSTSNSFVSDLQIADGFLYGFFIFFLDELILQAQTWVVKSILYSID